MRYVKSLGLAVLLAASLVSMGGCKKKAPPAAPSNAPAPAAPSNAPAPAAAPSNAPSNAPAPSGGS